MKKLFLYMVIAATALTMQSCLHDNEDTFEQSAAERIDKAVADAKTLLMSADNGWRLEYYLGSEYAYGGYNFLVKFGSDGKAHASGEIAEHDYVSSSSWDVIKDQGPVLTFNTYNEIMHELTQPMQDPTDGLEGDYEFIIMKTANDSIWLEGKKWGNKMLMTRMPSDVTWVDYLDQITELQDAFKCFMYKVDMNGTALDVELDLDNNQFTTTIGEEDVKVPFIYTTEGIKLQSPFEYNGASIQMLTLNADTQELTDNGVVLTGTLYPGWQEYEDLAGTYLFRTFGNRRITVVSNGDGKTFTVRGFSAYGDIVATYNKMYGSLSIATQYAGSYYGVYDLWLCPCNGETFTWDTSQVFKGTNEVAEDGKITITFKNRSYPAFWLMAFEHADDGSISGNTFAGTLSQMSGTNPMILVKQ